MKPIFGWLGAAAATLSAAACASYPAPTQHMADATAATRSAQEVGAASNPQAQLHLQMAQEEIARAQKLMANGDNERADSILSRAQADAELALQLTKETQTQAEAQKALQTVQALQGGTPTSVTTTTSATTTTTTTAPAPAPTQGAVK